MEKQKFNLARELKLNKLIFLSAFACIKVVTLVVILLFGVQIFLFIQRTQKIDQLEQLRRERTMLTQALANFKNEHNQWLERGTVGLERKIGSSVGFSAVLNDLAQLNLRNLWLTDIVISTKEGEITLGGESIFLADLSHWLSKLAVSPSFANKKIDFIKINKDPRSHNLIFKASTLPLSKNSVYRK